MSSSTQPGAREMRDLLGALNALRISVERGAAEGNLGALAENALLKAELPEKLGREEVTAVLDTVKAALAGRQSSAAEAVLRRLGARRLLNLGSAASSSELLQLAAGLDSSLPFLRLALPALRADQIGFVLETAVLQGAGLCFQAILEVAREPVETDEGPVLVSLLKTLETAVKAPAPEFFQPLLAELEARASKGVPAVHDHHSETSVFFLISKALELGNDPLAAGLLRLLPPGFEPQLGFVFKGMIHRVACEGGRELLELLAERRLLNSWLRPVARPFPADSVFGMLVAKSRHQKRDSRLSLRERVELLKSGLLKGYSTAPEAFYEPDIPNLLGVALKAALRWEDWECFRQLLELEETDCNIMSRLVETGPSSNALGQAPFPLLRPLLWSASLELDCREVPVSRFPGEGCEPLHSPVSVTLAGRAPSPDPLQRADELVLRRLRLLGALGCDAAGTASVQEREPRRLAYGRHPVPEPWEALLAQLRAVGSERCPSCAGVLPAFSELANVEQEELPWSCVCKSQAGFRANFFTRAARALESEPEPSSYSSSAKAVERAFPFAALNPNHLDNRMRALARVVFRSWSAEGNGSFANRALLRGSLRLFYLGAPEPAPLLRRFYTALSRELSKEIQRRQRKERREFEDELRAAQRFVEFAEREAADRVKSKNEE